ncbi:type II secretory pathway, component HofQ [Mesotoga sp. TolDC]|nr:type II secretory pathway, component HofQ [Mesotoga sp. TolDC]
MIRVRRIAVMFLVLGFFCIGFSNQLNSVMPSMDAESVTVTMIFKDTVTDYNIQSNPSKTIYSLALSGVSGRNMNLPLRMGPVEGLWTRQDPKRLSVNIALLIPAIDEPEVTIMENIVTLRFFRSSINVDIEKFTTYGMTVSTAMTYLFSEEMLDLSYVISPSVRNEEVVVGFSLAMPEDILRNILTSLGDRIAYSFLTDGTFYLGTPEEVQDLVNAFWKTYIGVEFNVEGESVSEQIERLRKTLPVNSFIEYLPNEASLMVFGDLQTHMTLSAALTTNTVTREYTVPWEITNIDIEPLTAYYELARKLNTTLFSDSLTIVGIPEFNKLIFSGNAAQVTALYEYIDLYREYVTSQDLDSSKTRITITLPDNFFLIEDVLKLGSSSGSGLTEDNTLVGTIFSILQSYAVYEDLSVDRTFEPIGKVTFELPNYLVPVLQKVVDSLFEISTDVSYTIVNYHLTIEESILSQVQRITGAAIEALGERKGYILKGSKNSIGTAEYLLSLFTGIAFEDYASTYLELKANDSFEEVSAFLRTFYAAQGLVEEEYTVEQIADRLVFMYAPSEIMNKAVFELEQHEKQIYRVTKQSILEISPEVYSSGLGELLQTILIENETANFIESAGLLVIRAYPDRLAEIESVIEERIPRITEMVENRISSQETRLSLQIMAIPGWDIEKFRAYLNDFLGSELFSEITLTTSGSGYIVIASQPLLEAISTEAEKLRGFENPSFRLETSIPSLAQFELLLEKLGIAVTIVPVENQFMIVGSKENVEEASKLVRQLSSGLPVQGDVSDTAVDYEFTFINLPYPEVEGISELLNKLSLSVEFVNTPTGVAVVATKERLEKAMEVINSVLSRIETIETGPRSYSLIDIEPAMVSSLDEILSRLGYEIDLVETPAGIIGIGVEAQLARAKSIVEEILKKETSSLPHQGDGDRSYLIISSKPEIEIASINSVISVFNFDLIITPVYDKIVVVGDSYDLQLFRALHDEILTSESVEGAFISKELSGVPGWDSDRLLSYLGVVLGVEKTASVSLVQTARGYIVNCPQSILESIESEFERLRSIESPSYSIERRMPSLDEMNSLLSRLGIIVDILKVDDYFVIIGSSTSVNQAKELVSRLLEAIGDESEMKQTAFEVSSISREDMPAFTEIFSSIGMEVKLLESPSGILIIGNDGEVSRAIEVADSILEKRASTVDSEIVFEFVPVSSDEIGEYSLIFEKMRLNAELLSSPSGVLVIGSSEEVSEAKSVVQIIDEQKQQFDTTEDKRNISTFVRRVAGWSDEVFSNYLKDFLNEDQYSRVSISPSVSGYIVAGPAEILQSIEAEVSRLQEIQDPHFVVQRGLPPLDQLELLIGAMGIKVEIIPVEDKYLIVGNRESVVQTNQIIDQLIEAIYPEGKPVEDTVVSKTFIFLPVKPEDVAPLETVMERLGITSELVQISTGVVAVGSEEELLKALDVVESVMAHSESVTAELELNYRFVDVRSGSTEQFLPIIDRLKIEIELLDTPTGVVAIGAESELDRAEELIEAINSRAAEDVPLQDKYESYLLLPLSAGITVESLEPALELLDYRVFAVSVADKIIAIGNEEDLLKFKALYLQLQAVEVDREERISLDIKAIPGWDIARVSEYLRLFLGADDFDRISIVPSSTGFVALTPKALMEALEGEISRLREFEDPAFTVLERIPPVEDLEGLLSRLGVLVDLVSMGSSTIVIGSGDDVQRTGRIIDQLLDSVTYDVTAPEAVEYSVLDISADDMSSFNAIFERLAIDVSLISSPSGVIAIGSQQAVARTAAVVEDILSRRTTPQVYEPIYAFTGIPSADIGSYQTILDKLNSGVELLQSTTGVLMIGDAGKVQEAVKTVNAILEREALFDESEGQPDRVSNVAALVPGWNDAKYASYFTDFLGVDDFSRISITPSTSGYIVIGPEEVVSRLVAEASRLAGIEDPFFVIEDSLPAIDQLDTLLDRLGLKVTILPVENKHLIVGIKESVEKTVELIKMLRSDVEAPLSSRKYDYLIMPANEGSFETIRQVLSELKIDATALSFGSNVILVGYGEDLEDAASVVNSINERTLILETDKELKYSFTEIPDDRIDEFKAILDSLKLDVELLSSPSGVVLVGTEEEAEKANEVIRSVLSKAEQDETVESRFFNNPAGWEEGKLVAYLRGFLGEKDWAKVSATPVQSGYLLVGPSEILNRIHSETVRLAGLEKPYYEIVETVPSIQNLQAMLEKMGLAVTVVTVDGRSMVIGPESDVLQTVKVFGELAEGVVLPRGDEPDVFDFVEIPSEEVESFRTIFARLGIRVDLLSTPTGVIVVGRRDDISKALETITSILSRREVQVVNGEQSYMVVEIRDGFDLASAQSVISAFSIDTYPLSVAGKLVIIGAEKEIGRFVQIRNDIISEHKVTVIVPREVTIEELNGIINTLGLEMSVLEIRGSFVVYGKEGEIEQVRDILSRLTSDEPTEKTQEMRIFTGIYQSTDFLNQLLSSMGSSLKIYGEGDRIVAVGSADDIGMFENLMQEIGSEPSAVELTAKFYPRLEGWTGETLAEFFRAMNFAVEVFHESSQGYLLIGPADELNRVPDVMDGLELKTKKLTTLYSVPSGMTYEELREILVSAGFSLSYTKLGQSMSISGLEDDVNMAVALLDEVIRSGLGKGVSYRLIELPVDLTLEKLEKIMSDMALDISSVQVDGEVMLIGPDSDLRTAKEVVEYLTPEDPSFDEKRIYSVIPLGEGLSFAEISALVESLSLSVEILPVGGDIVVIGTESNVDRFRELVSSISATLGIGSVESLEYSIVEKVEEIWIDQFRELLASLNIPVKIVEVSDYLVFIGSSDNNGKAVDLFSRFETEDKKPVAEEIEFATLSLPEGFDLNSLSTIFDKLDFKVDLDAVGNVLLLIGTKDSIENAQALVEKLVWVSTGESGVRNVFEILEPKESVSAELLNQLFRLIGIDVEILEGDTALVFVGSQTDVEMALEVYDSLGRTAEVDEGPLSYTITILPKNLTPGQLETAFDSIQIPVGVIEAGDYAIIVGTKPSLARAQELVSSLRIGIDASGTSADGSISYVTFTLPEGTEIEQFETIAGLMELKLKFEPVGDRVFMIGTGEDIGEFEQVLSGLVSEKAGIVNEFRFAKKLSGIDAETLETYLLAKEISLSGVFNVSGGYLIIGTRESIDEAQAVIDYLADNQQVHFSFVDLPSTLRFEVLQAMVNELMLDVVFTQITQSRYLLIGEINDIDRMKSILSDAVVGESKFLDYEIVIVSKEFNDYLADERIREDLDNSLDSIGVSTYIGKFDDRLLIVGEKTHVDVAKKLINELDEAASFSGIEEKIKIEDLPPVSGWSIEQITQFLEAAEIQLRSIIEYSGRLIGIGTQVGLENARAALSILAVDLKRESVRIEKSLVTETQLKEIISKLDLKVEFVDLERQWLLIGEPESLMIVTRTVEEAAADKEISRYITDLTVNPQELADLLRESIEGITVQTFDDLQMLLIKSKSSALLDAAEKMVKDVQDSRKAVDPLEKGVVVTGSTVRINVADQDLESLLRLVADKLGISLLFVDKIVENVTMSVEGLTWDGLVKVINATKPVEISKIDDIYAVTKKEQKAGEEPTDVELVYRVYHNVEEVTRLIEFYGGEVLSDPVNGYIVVRGLAKSRVDNIFDEIGSSLAQPKKQVRIETRLVDKSLVDELQREFKTAIGVNSPEILIENGSIDLDFRIIDYLDITQLIDDIVNTATARIEADLSNRDNDSDLISSPSIVSMSGEEAKIHIGDTIPYLVRTIEYVEGNPVEIETIEYLNTGVELRITPTVNDDGKILLDLYIKVSEPEKYVDGTRTLYGEKTREANSRLIISNGNTLTIGGLVANKDTVTVNKMPFLSDLPFIGKLFTTENRTSDKRELVIFITAEVVEP